MLHACYGNRNERCWAEAITCSAEFAAVSLCNIKSWPVNSCSMVFTLKHTQNNGSFQLCRTQRGFPGCSMKSRSHFLSSYISPENPPVCLWLCEYVTNNGRVPSTTKTQWKFYHKQIWGRNEQDVNLHCQKSTTLAFLQVFTSRTTNTHYLLEITNWNSWYIRFAASQVATCYK